jgi:5-methylcytosine-specific restriction endonuclease McrA
VLLADLFDARGVLRVADDHPLAALRCERVVRVAQLRMTIKRGAGVCAWCESGEPIPGGRRYHAGCDDEVAIRTVSGVARTLVHLRDRGVCAECGRDTSEDPPVRNLWATDARPWIADHILPVWAGGGICGLANYRTLCLSCNDKRTGKDAGARAVVRKRERFEQLGGVVVPRQLSLRV